MPYNLIMIDYLLKEEINKEIVFPHPRPQNFLADGIFMRMRTELYNMPLEKIGVHKAVKG